MNRWSALAVLLAIAGALALRLPKLDTRPLHNDEGINASSLDKLTWGVYRSSARSWIPSDAEWQNDPGVGLTWLATDSERTDDAGISSHPSTTIGCQSFPISSYALVDVQHGFGNIQVRP